MVQVDDRFCSICSICLSEHNPALNDRTSLLQEYRSALYHLLSYSQHLTPRRTCTKRYAFKLFPERNLFFWSKDCRCISKCDLYYRSVLHTAEVSKLLQCCAVLRCISI